MTYRLRPYPETVSEQTCKDLAGTLKIPLAVSRLLCQRGISTPQQAHLYLSPTLKELPSPFLFKDMKKAVSLIEQAMKKQWPVVIYGDYDVDGICATSLLVCFLTLLELDVHWHVPNRLTEGYGLSSKGLQEVRNRVAPPALLITVDNGISAVQEVAEARLMGFHVIITDHHEPPKTLPEADALINPKQQGCVFPFSELSGVGVAFFLIIALRAAMIERGFWQKTSAPNLKDYLDLVALGTVADVMPLVGVNRILVRAGTEILTERKRPGIWALCEQVGLKEGGITTEDISFRLGPRINASGRMGSPETAARLLMSKDTGDSIQLAGELEQKNNTRRTTEADILPEAIAQCELQVEKNSSALVVYNTSWHPGVIGIVASRLCDRFLLPVIALTDDAMSKGCIKGSGRTVGEINLFEAVDDCSSYLERYGGHPKAIGLSLQREKLADFTSAFCSRVDEQVQDGTIKSNGIIVDHLIESGDVVDLKFIPWLRQLEPFGEENPEPIFLIKNQLLSHVSLVKGEHLKFSLQLNGRTYRGIGFGLGKCLSIAQGKIDLAFKFKHSVFRGEKRVELMAVNLSPTY